MQSNKCHQNARPRITPRGRTRAALLLGTALVAIELPAQAQPAPGTHPTGGSVVAGQATISNNGATTLINQASQTASINWQSFSVAADQSVVFHQPGSTSIALNRVIGPDPSIIAGRITANGQIVLINQSGVLFTRGSQVDTAGLVVSAAGMSDRNFAAGRLVFDQAAHPGAMVSNAGNITIRQAGLAALVAPQVANSGLITAKLGHVVLAGVQTATLDLYGDRLVSLNVTGAVTSVSVGGQVIPALVTNTGTILAPGGIITLTARDADALVSQLVTAGGLISTDGAGARGGQVLVEGVGGSVEISGTLSAQGTGAVSRGGAVQVAATGNVALDPGAVINASGTRGGGTVALGTRLARARHGSGVSKHAASRVLIAQGATVRADATLSGAGGRIAVLGQQSVAQAGALSARGAGTGNGGSIELSTNGSLAITGTENAGGAAGRAGSITIDPPNVEITNGAPDPGYTAISTATIDGMTGEVIILAGDTLRLLSAVVLGPGATGFALTAGRDLILDAAFDAGSLAGTFSAGVGGIQQIAGLVTAGSLDIQTTGALTQSGGAMLLGTLSGTAAGIALAGANDIRALGPIDSTGGVDIATTGTLQVEGALDALSNAVTLTGTSIDLSSTVTATTLDLIATAGDITQTKAGVIDAGTLSASAAAGNGLSGQILLDTAANTISILASVAATADIVLDDNISLLVDGPVRSQSGAVTLNETGYFQNLDIAGPVTAATTITLIATDDIAIGGTLTAASAVLNADAGLITENGGAILLGAGTLTAQAAAGITLNSTGNSLATLGFGNAGDGSFLLADGAALTVTGRVGSDGNLTLDVGGAGHDLTLAGVLSSGTVALNVTGGSVSELPDGGINAGTLTASVAGDLSLSGTLNRAGKLDVLSAGGNIDFAQAGAVKLIGDVTAGGSASLTGSNVTQFAGTIAAGTGLTLTAQSGSLAFGGVLSSPTMTLTASADITETLPGAGSPTGAITATSLTGSAGGTASLSTPASAGEPNQVGTLAAFTTGGAFVLTDASALALAGQLSAPSVTLNAGGPIDERGAGAIAATLLAASSTGAIQLDGSNAIATLTGMAAGGALLVNDIGPLTLDGTITAGAGATLTASSALSQSAGVLDAAGPLSLTASSIAFSGLIEAPGQVLTLIATAGSIVEAVSGGPPGTLRAGTLTGSASGALELNTPSGNEIATLAGFTASSDLVLTDSLAPTLTGLVSAGQTLALTVAPGNSGTLLLAGASIDAADLALTTPGEVVQTAGLLASSGDIAISAAGLEFAGTIHAAGTTALTLGGDLVEAPTGALVTSELTGTAGGSLALASAQNSIATIGSLMVGGQVTIADQAALTVTGPITSASAGIVLTDNQGLALDGSLSGGTVALAAAGITQASSGSVYAALLTGSAAGDATLDGANHIAALGPFTAGGTLNLADDGPLSVTGAISAGGALGMTVQGDLTLLTDIGGTDVTLAASGALDQQAGTVRGTAIALSAASVAQSLAGALVLYDAGKVSLAASGAIALGGSIDAAQGGVTFTTPSGVTETGQLAAATLAGTVGGTASFTGAGIAVAELDGFSAATGLTLADGVDLAVDGRVSAGGIRLSIGGAGTAMTISGTLLSSGVVALAAPQDISQTAGAIMAATTASLDAAGTISLAGEVSAPTILIGSAQAPTLLAWHDNTLLTSSILSHDQLLNSLPPNDGSQPGIYVRTGSLLQTGTTSINPQGGPATLEVVLTGSGKLTLDPRQAEGLLAPSTFTFFDLARGTASGHLEVSSLFVEYGDAGASSPTRFTGSVDGIAGFSAAALAQIGPLPDQEYQINGCALGSSDCVLLSPITVPVTNPVLEVSFDPPRRRLDDDDLVLPDVAEQDY